MRLTEAALRGLVRGVLAENMVHEDHRTLSGETVPFGCVGCVDDIHTRIEDAAWHRDRCSRGSADRSHYNGLLASLRRALRAALKELERSEIYVEEEQAPVENEQFE